MLLGFSILLGNSPSVDLYGIVAGHVYFFLDDVFPYIRAGRGRRPLVRQPCDPTSATHPRPPSPSTHPPPHPHPLRLRAMVEHTTALVTHLPYIRGRRVTRLHLCSRSPVRCRLDLVWQRSPAWLLGAMRWLSGETDATARTTSSAYRDVGIGRVVHAEPADGMAGVGAGAAGANAAVTGGPTDPPAERGEVGAPEPDHASMAEPVAGAAEQAHEHVD